jgi:membrane protein DedA with SNARE-associated domain
VLGFLEIPFIHFMRIQFFTSCLWALIFIMLGYFFGDTAIKYAHSFDKFVLIVFGFMVGLVIVEKMIGYFIEKKEQKKS